MPARCKVSITRTTASYFTFLSALITTGTPPAKALRNSIDLARHVDALGYSRYWTAEHHNLASVASPAPDLLMGEDGRVLGLRDERGQVHIASARTDRFVSDAWARRHHAFSKLRFGGRGSEDLALIEWEKGKPVTVAELTHIFRTLNCTGG